jgi:hypothetical protein
VGVKENLIGGGEDAPAHDDIRDFESDKGKFELKPIRDCNK